MRAAFVLFKRDFLTTVLSPLFFIICALCGFLWTYLFLRSVYQFEQQSAIAMQLGQVANLHQQVVMGHLSSTHIILLLAIPLLTMRSLAEEKKNRTYDLLLTSPISSTDIAIGKYFACFGAVLLLLLLSALYPLGLGLVADLAAGPFMTAYLAMILLSGLYTAVGVFTSACTSSSLLSGFLAIVFNLIILFSGQLSGLSDHPLMSEVLKQISVTIHLQSLFSGTIEVKSLVFFTTVIGFFVFLSQRMVEASRWR